MVKYREIRLNIDCSKGTLVSDSGAKITRDDMLPRLILADEVIMRVTFVRVQETDRGLEMQSVALEEDASLRIIGDFDYDDDTGVMFSAVFLQDESDLSQGVAVFHIKTNFLRFKEVLKNNKLQKCEFVIFASFADPIATVVLAKDYFIAENRPCDSVDYEEPLPEEFLTKDELQALLDCKSPLHHAHSEYAATDHTHTMDEISDFIAQGNVEYTPGDGIAVSAANVISVDWNTVAKKGDIINYTAGTGISIENGVISCTVTPEGGAEYTAGNGINISEEGVISCTVDGVSQEDFDAAIGDINSILDNINGEEV